MIPFLLVALFVLNVVCATAELLHGAVAVGIFNILAALVLGMSLVLRDA